MTTQTAANAYRVPVSAEVLEETQRLYRYARQPHVAYDVWRKWLEPQDQSRLGGEFYSALAKYRHAIGMLMEARGLNEIQALFQVATYQGLSELDRNRLLKAWGFPEEQVVVDDLLPTWDPEAGKLYWGRELIRSLRLFNGYRSNLQVLIEAFADEGWPESVDTPFEHDDQLHETIRQLRKGLTRIRFRAVASASRCRWEVSPARGT